jgi:hypothetical protein
MYPVFSAVRTRIDVSDYKPTHLPFTSDMRFEWNPTPSPPPCFVDDLEINSFDKNDDIEIDIPHFITTIVNISANISANVSPTNLENTDEPDETSTQTVSPTNLENTDEPDEISTQTVSHPSPRFNGTNNIQEHGDNDKDIQTIQFDNELTIVPIITMDFNPGPNLTSGKTRTQMHMQFL